MVRSALVALAAAVLVAADDPGSDEDRLQGTWVLVRVDKPTKGGGREVAECKTDDIKMKIERDKITWTFQGQVIREQYYLLRPDDTIKSIDITSKTRRGVMLTLGIYRFEDGKLTLCLDTGMRPPTFTPGLGASTEVLTFTRQKRRP